MKTPSTKGSHESSPHIEAEYECVQDTVPQETQEFQQADEPSCSASRFRRGCRNGTPATDNTRHAKRNSRQSSATLSNHPITVSLILQLPWIGLTALHYSVFELMTSYLTSMGVYYFVPRYMPSVLTFIMAPIVGAASDRSIANVGRRNHFLIIATIVLTISTMLLGGSKSIFGDHLLLLTINVAFIVWGAVALEVGLRSRIFDIIPKDFQVHAHACGSMWHSVGLALGMVLVGGGSNVVYGDQITEAVMLQTCGTVVAAIVVTVALSIYLKPEAPLQHENKRVVAFERFFVEIWDVVVGAPLEIKMICLLQLFTWMAWYSFDNQKYKWWAEYVYLGCLQTTTTVTCSPEGVALYTDGLNLAKIAVQGISAVQFLSTLSFFVLIPKNPSAIRLKQVTLFFMSFGVVMLLVALIVGAQSHTASFVSFILTGVFYSAIDVFPFAMTGIVAKDFMDASSRYNTNGVYVSLMVQFACCAKFAVEEFNTNEISSMGSSNILALPMLLFVLSTAYAYFYKFEV
ncbi:unnamed protein product [Aphanomyces euteiches]|nr:hypothetical protein AeRB84_006657 [Aphanomyces euteiches]